MRYMNAAFFLVLPIAVLFFGCSNGEEEKMGGPGQKCLPDGSCNGLLECVDGLCSPVDEPGESWGPCIDGKYCNLPDLCIDGVCIPPDDDPPDTRICEPGERVSCDCPGGESGTAVCSHDGMSYSSCECPDPVCSESALTVTGSIRTSVSTISADFNVDAQAFHRHVPGSVDSGCISRISLVLNQAGMADTGCRLKLEFDGYSYNSVMYGGLGKIEFSAGASCPGFQENQGVFRRSHDASGSWLPIWFTGSAEVEPDADQGCVENISFLFPDTDFHLESDDGRILEFNPGNLLISGVLFSEGDGSLHCVEHEGCPRNMQDGGDGWCVASGNCSPGYRDRGDGVCIPEGEGPPPFEVMPCGNLGFGEGFALFPVEGTHSGGRLHAAPAPDGGALLAWRELYGSGVRVTHADWLGNPIRHHEIDGHDIYGLAATGESFAILVTRGSDILALAVAGYNGDIISDNTVIGDVDHGVVNNDWFGSIIREARLIASPDNKWVAYYTVQRLWPDLIAHYGDQLQRFNADGTPEAVLWGWGCSHSMEVRISHNGTALGPVCSSDCFPSKGIHFNHRGGLIYPDKTRSNCAGGYGTTLGGSIPFDDGFWVVYTATDDRESHDAAITRIRSRQPGSPYGGYDIEQPIWLTEDSVDVRHINSARFEDHLLVAFESGNENRFYVLDGADGEILEGPISIEGADLSSAGDFFTWPHGDIGWIQRYPDGKAALARLRACR